MQTVSMITVHYYYDEMSGVTEGPCCWSGCRRERDNPPNKIYKQNRINHNFSADFFYFLKYSVNSMIVGDSLLTLVLVIAFLFINFLLAVSNGGVLTIKTTTPMIPHCLLSFRDTL